MQRIHLKHQVLFSLKNNEKYLWMSSAAVVTGALKVKDLSYMGTMAILVIDKNHSS